MSVSMNDEDFLRHFSAITEEASIHQFFVCSIDRFPAFKPDNLSEPDWINTLNGKKMRACAALSALQSAASSCVLYGSKFDDESFFGQGRNFKKLLTKKGRGYIVNVESDIISGCENCWTLRDQKYPAAVIGDAHFVIDYRKADWRAIFSLHRSLPFGSPKILGFANSKAAIRNVLRHVKDDPDRVVIWFAYPELVVFAGKNRLYEIIKSAMVYCSLVDHEGKSFAPPTPRSQLIEQAS